MMLSLKNVAYYLLESGLVRPEAVVDGDLTVVETRRRNLNFKVIRKNGTGLFVKQIQIWSPQVSAELQREAVCYWLTQNDPAFARLARIVPRHLYYDSGRCILITELFPNSESLSDYHRRLGKFPPNVGVALGRALADYHQLGDGDVANAKQLSSFPKATPWILSIHQQTPSQLNDISPGNTQMIGVMQQYPDYKRALDELREGWQRSSFIHGDMKWDNCLVEAQGAADQELKLKIVDWELADVGDACWDVGAVFHGYLSFWIMSINMPTRVPPSESLHLAQYPIEAMQPAIRAFWETYRSAMGLSGQTAQACLERSVKYAAARMIQTVYEYMHRSAQLTPNAFCLLQVSMNVLQKPLEAIQDLLALSL